ncbi:MAG: GIY-YIG nuclease family protein [Planctomycetota bacterium]
MNNRPWFVYILRCRDDSLYTGITNDIPERIKEHNSGEGAKYTRTRVPVRLVYREKYPDKSSARKREMEIQGWPRETKLKLLDKGF